MKIILSLVLMLAGWVLYFVLTFAGFYRLYPFESYALMVIAIWLAWSVARRKGGWWRYVICGFVSLLSVLFIYWTAVFSQLPEKRLLTTVELKLNFLAPVFNGDLYGTGKCVKVGKQLGLGEASVVDASGRLAAHGTSTVMILDSLPADPAADMPPKYL